MSTEIVALIATCKCGCGGKDPWHKRTYQRVIMDKTPVSQGTTAHLKGFRDPKTIQARGRVQLPWGFESVVQATWGRWYIEEQPQS